MKAIGTKTSARRGAGGRWFILGALFVVLGGLLEALALAAPLYDRIVAHGQDAAALVAQRDDLRRETQADETALRSLDLAWDRYDLKILRIETGAGDPQTSDRDFLTSFQARIIDQLSDASPATALAEVPPGIARDANFQTSRTDFLTSFHEVREGIVDLSGMVTNILGHPSARYRADDTEREQEFFGAEKALEMRWAAVRLAAQRVGDTDSAALARAQGRIDAGHQQSVFSTLAKP